MSDASVPTAVVTGATRGIGAAVAERLVRGRYRVVIVGRNAERCEAMRRRLAALGGPAPPEPVVVDLTRIGDARSAAVRIRAAHPSLRLLVNNAGALFARRHETVEGHENTYALNVLAPFVLTHGLAPALAASGGGARVVNVASEAHRRAHLDLSELEARHRYSGFRAYSRSKLALILLTYAFSRRWPAGQIAFFAVHPGFVRSAFGQNDPGALALLLRAGMMLGISPERAARTVGYAATSERLEGLTGRYVRGERLARSSPRSLDAGMAERLWEEVERSVGGPAPVVGVP
ncbi:MAG TPA: SDR family NAD(P)-dependent oxidoreductase [Thermoplasmata archaeon]